MEMRRLLSTPEHRTCIPKNAIDTIIHLTDKDKNGRLSFDEFLDMVIGYDYMASDRPIVRSVLRAAAYTVVPRNDRRYMAEYTCSPPPLFMIIISLIEIVIYIAPYDSVLIYNPYRRYEAWRFLTYMLVHASLTHIVFNIVVQLVLGIPLEMVHRGWRIMVVYFAGVIAGSLVISVSDPKVFLCGASGGVYALIACHLASVILVQNSKKIPIFQVRDT